MNKFIELKNHIFNDMTIWLNVRYIKCVTAQTDHTIITIDGGQYFVRESVEEIMHMINN